MAVQLSSGDRDNTSQPPYRRAVTLSLRQGDGGTLSHLPSVDG